MAAANAGRTETGAQGEDAMKLIGLKLGSSMPAVVAGLLASLVAFLLLPRATRRLIVNYFIADWFAETLGGRTA